MSSSVLGAMVDFTQERTSLIKEAIEMLLKAKVIWIFYHRIS
jgi:hypothetical protein